MYQKHRVYTNIYIINEMTSILHEFQTLLSCYSSLTQQQEQLWQYRN